MVSLRAASVDDPDAHELLDEYFHSREIGFAHQNTVYTITLPADSTFTPPAGVFLVVDDDEGAPVGCGGIRRIADAPGGIRYEVKHLYLRPSTRGKGWGRVLLQGLEDRARAFGAAELVLDTHHSLEAAAGLYSSAGFVSIEPFNDNPNATVWLRKDLTRVKATVTIRSPEEGGRSAPVFLDGRFRPHVRVTGDEEYLGVIFFGDEDTVLRPGGPAPVILHLIYDVHFYSRLRPGAEFDVLEGARIVGRGVVD